MPLPEPTTPLPIPAASPTQPAARLLTLDALRGFDMCRIVGADASAEALDKASHPPPLVAFLARRTSHADRAEFRFYDLIFPMFVFIAAVSLVCSLTRLIGQEGRAAALERVFWRATLPYLLGIFYCGGCNGPLEKTRLLGVLQRIALAYLFAGLRARLIARTGLLVGYSALVSLVPVFGVVAGRSDGGRDLANWMYKQCLPWRKWEGDHDSEDRWPGKRLDKWSVLETLAAFLRATMHGSLRPTPSGGGNVAPEVLGLDRVPQGLSLAAPNIRSRQPPLSRSVPQPQQPQRRHPHP